MTADLSQFTYYNNRSLGGVTDPNSADAQSALRAVQQYDPNANYRPTYGSDGQLIGYTLDVDASKLPGVNGSGSLGATSGHGSGADFVPNFSTVQQNMQLENPNAVANSPNYGKVTANSNINTSRSWVDTYGPAIVAAFGFGIPYLAAAMSSGAIGAGAAGAGAAFDPSLNIGETMGPYNPTYGDMLPFNPTPADIGLSGVDGAASLSGFQVPGGASGAFTNALGGAAPAASLPGFQIPGGAAGMFGVAGSGIDPSTAAILESINSPSLFDVGPTFDQAIQDGVTGGSSGSSGSGGGSGSGSGFDASKIPAALNALSKIPGIGGGTGNGTGSGSTGLLGGGTYNMQPYKSLTQVLRNFGLLGMPNG